ncbi:MAG: hypothetical protein IT302_06480, partial [Dehalococcoidia bacterium]|nr:hypothetical protein [Dehalococcoidia bacterium]
PFPVLVQPSVARARRARGRPFPVPVRPSVARARRAQARPFPVPVRPAPFLVLALSQAAVALLAPVES